MATARPCCTRQTSRLHWCEHLSPMWTLAQMWHTGSGHMQAFHPSSLRSHWCCEYTSHDCWLWQHSDSHNPSQKIGPSSFSPGQARPSLRKTLIDLMDLYAVHTPSPNKQSAQDLSPLRQRGSACPPLAKKHWDYPRGQRQPAKLVNFTAGPRGRFERAVQRFIILQIKAPTPILLPTFRSIRVESGSHSFFVAKSVKDSCESCRGVVPSKNQMDHKSTVHHSCFYMDWFQCSTPQDIFTLFLQVKHIRVTIKMTQIIPVKD